MTPLITQELIARINELSKKQRSTGLNKAERSEQQELRSLYLADIRAQMKGMLDTIKFADPVEKEAEPQQPHVKNIEIQLTTRPVLH